MLTDFMKSNSYFYGHSFKKAKFGPINLVVIQPTPYCNLNCDYCYLPNRNLKHKFSLNLLEPIFKLLFNSAYTQQSFTVIWHAGEPLTMSVAFYEEAIQKINELNRTLTNNRYNIKQSFQTNATLINPSWCELIHRHRIKIGVSLDGPAFIHDLHRKTHKGLGTHASTMRGIALLQKYNIPFCIIAVLTIDSLDFPDEIFDFFIQHNIQHVGFNIDEIEGSHLYSSLSSKETVRKYSHFMERFYALVKQNEGCLRVREFENARALIFQEEKDLYDIRGQFTPFTMVNIDHRGNFSTFSPELLSMSSDIYGDFILGHVSTDTIDSVCKTEKFKVMHQAISTGVEMCRNSCDYFSVCGGGAPSNKYFENGSFDSTETLYCKYNKKIITNIVLEDIENSLELYR